MTKFEIRIFFLIFDFLIQICVNVCEYNLKHIVFDKHKKLYFLTKDKFFAKINF